MTAPKRVRVAGDLYHGQMPEGSVYVGRGAPGLAGSKFANPHPVGRRCRLCAGVEHSRGAALIAFRRHLEDHPELIAAARVELAGRDLACWCSTTEQCHADVLLELLAATVETAGIEAGDIPQTLAERFEQFHQQNPRVYEVLCRLGREWISRTGRRKAGISALYEVARWEIALATNDPDFKVNNTFKPFYSRLIMRDEPDLADLFDLRRSVADEWLGSPAESGAAA